MDRNKKIYTQDDLANYTASIKREYEQTLRSQRERIEELRKNLAAAERKNAEFEKQKELVYKAITTALKKADDISRVSLIKYNQELAQLKSFHDKWMGYYNRIIAAYPLDDELVETSRLNGKISAVLEKAGDIDAQYREERERLKTSIESDEDDDDVAAVAESVSEPDAHQPVKDIYTDRSPAGFSFAEALHPKEDLKDIMRELGVLMDD